MTDAHEVDDGEHTTDAGDAGETAAGDAGETAAGDGDETADAGDADGVQGADGGFVDSRLYEQARALLEPGEIDLVGAIVEFDLSADDEPQLHQHTIEVGDVIAEHAGHDPADTYVYSGNDDPEFGVNQHQGLTLGDEFVWECQQLYREGRFVVVFYYEAGADQDAILADLREAGFDAVGVEPAE